MCSILQLHLYPLEAVVVYTRTHVVTSLLFDYLAGRFLVCMHVPKYSLCQHTVTLFSPPPSCPIPPPPAPGLQQYYPDPSVLVGQLVCVAANLKPAKLAGEPSQAMVLAAEATGAGGQTIVKALQPPGAWAVLEVARAYGEVARAYGEGVLGSIQCL
jgi:hypothetical protein